jgi:hypothetical protein
VTTVDIRGQQLQVSAPQSQKEHKRLISTFVSDAALGCCRRHPISATRHVGGGCGRGLQQRPKRKGLPGWCCKSCRSDRQPRASRLFQQARPTPHAYRSLTGPSNKLCPVDQTCHPPATGTTKSLNSTWQALWARWGQASFIRRARQTRSYGTALQMRRLSPSGLPDRADVRGHAKASTTSALF